MITKIKDFREIKLSKYRKYQNLSQEKLAELINMSRSSVSNIEVNGCVDINLIALLTRYLDFEVSIKNGFIKIIENISEGENKNMNNNNQNTSVKNIKAALIEKHIETYISELKSFIKHYLRMNNIDIDMDLAPKEHYSPIIKGLKDNNTIVAKIPGANISLEIDCILYDGGDCYLSEFRAFDEGGNCHLDSYFPVYTKDSLELIDLCEDNIWDYRDWIEVQD